jgi:putative transposase
LFDAKPLPLAVEAGWGISYLSIHQFIVQFLCASNRQQNRKGTLFEGRYQFVEVDRDEYILHLCRYIHLNPVKANLVLRPENWQYSNYREWVNLRRGTLQDRKFITGTFQSPDEYAAFCEDYSERVERESLDLIDKYRLD